MKVSVLYFGILKDVFGRDREEVEVAEHSSIEAMLGILRGRAKTAPGLWESVAVAVNQEYAQRSIVLREGDEVALLPPVSGGLKEGLQRCRSASRGT